MDYSIIIPVFNKAGFTRNCLDTLRPSLEGAGTGEVIVVDNASSDETPELLTQYPWIRVIRNDANLGFAAANNQGARAATGEFLVLLNNDTQAFPGWLAAMLETAREPGVGVVGAKLLFANRTIQHGGVVVSGMFLSRQSIVPFHQHLSIPSDEPDANVRRDYQIVTGACLVTPRALYDELGGLDEAYWNGYEDVDYCLKVRGRGMRVVYEPGATLFHYESQSGVQRFRKTTWNLELLEERWRGKVALDAGESGLRRGLIRRAQREPRGSYVWSWLPAPFTTVAVHGAEPSCGREAFEATVRDNACPIHSIVWLTREDAIAPIRDEMELRGHRYLVLVHGSSKLAAGWLDALVAGVEGHFDAAAATAAPELGIGDNVSSVAADARCTLLSLQRIPRHVRLRDFDTLDGAVADLLLRALDLERGTRGAAKQLSAFPDPSVDAAFEREYAMPVRDVLDPDPESVARRLARRQRRARGLVSIVTLSWNAVEFTKLALESIRTYTSEPYEVIVVDNGSGTETVDYLRAIDDPHVRVIYNPTNRGFAGGCNIGIAASAGDYVVLLNNDVIVTERWIDDLLDPFDRIAGLGVTAPRSNKVVGPQIVDDANYSDAAGIHAYARARREMWRHSGYVTERAIGLCLCIDRRVIDEIGGLDERFGLGNFEDDDLCIRVRAAGYFIYVCDDVFIHHFGSRSFAANNVDYGQTLKANWAAFAAKWGLAPEMADTGYDPRGASARGFDRAAHYVPLPNPEAPSPLAVPPKILDVRAIFYAVVEGDGAWTRVAEFVKRFVKVYRCDDPVMLSIACLGDPDAETVGARIARVLEKLAIDVELAPQVEVSDEDDASTWKASLTAPRLIDVAELVDRSPSGLRRILSEALA